MNSDIINASVTAPQINACTYPQGPRGVGIASVTQSNNSIIVTMEDGNTSELEFPAWWFGTKEEYASLDFSQKQRFFLFFIRDDI